MKSLRAALCCLVLAGRAPAAPAETSLQGELGVWLGDDDVLHASDDTVPASPGASFGALPPATSTLDALTTRANRREQALTLELTVRSTGQGSSGAAVARWGVAPAGDAQGARLGVEDLGSYVELAWGDEGKARLRLRLFPLAADGLRVGWLEPLAWAGDAGPQGESPYSSALLVPGAELRHDAAETTSFVALKTARMMLRRADGVLAERTQYALLGGASWRVVPRLELGVHGAYLEHGSLEQPDVRGVGLRSAGSSVRAVFGDVRRPPEMPAVFPGAVPSPGWAISVEGALLWQRLKDAERAGAVRWAPARAAAVLGTWRTDGFELTAGAVFRDAAFVVRQAPGWVQPESRPATVVASDELTVFVAQRYSLSRFELGLDLALQRPSALLAPASDGSVTAIVVGPAGRLTSLPAGVLPEPTLELRPSLGVRAFRALGLALWLDYRHDRNRVALNSSRTLTAHFLGYGAGARAKF